MKCISHTPRFAPSLRTAASITALAGFGLSALVVPAAAHADTVNPTAGYVSTPVASDAFARTVSTGFGSADLGGAWSTVQTGTGGTVSVSNGNGIFGAVQPGHQIEQILNSVNVADSSGQVSFTIPSVPTTGFADYVGLELRRQDAHDFYSASVQVQAGGNASVYVTRQSATAGTTVIKNVSIGKVASGQKVTIALVVTGSSTVNVATRAWTDGSATPAWTSTTDTTGNPITTAGTAGISIYTGGGTTATSTNINNFSLQSLRVPTAPVASYTSNVKYLSDAVDASASTDANAAISKYSWDFGDGATASGITASHTYAKSGTYTVTLTTTDSLGMTATATHPVTVVADVPPVSTFVTGGKFLAASFDGSASTDSDGTIAAYSWNFGDAATATGAKVTHTYTAAGTYTVTLTVTDDAGVSTTSTRSVTVATDVPPVASFLTSNTYLVGSFDGSASTDSDGTIASYAWNFGDGTSGTGAKATHTYAKAGTYTVSLTVTDDNGATGTSSHSVTVAANVAPTAAFSSSATLLAAQFDGSASADSDGTVASYAWNFGDGSTGTGVTASHTYAAAGNYTVSLTVTDNAGATTSVSHAVSVTASHLVTMANPSAGAGSAPVGTTNYPVPAGAVFVSTTGNDSSGNGSLAAPYATVKTALTHVSAGGTIVLRGGTYNQSTTIGLAVTGITIQSYPNEAVWFDGSIPVTGWTQSGSTWVHSGWTPQFDSSQSFTSGSNAGGFVNPSYPMAANPDQVFSDGTQLVQVAANPGPGQFAVNYSAQTITVGSDPTSHAMRASNLGQAFVVGGGNITMRGFGVRNYATALPQQGTIYVGGNTGHETFENLDINNNATVGLATTLPGIVINHVSANYNGMSGMEIGTNVYGQDGAGEIVEHSQMSNNNTQNFNTQPAAAGIKIGRISGISVIDNLVQNNTGTTGIWTDQSVSNFNISGNTVTGNPIYGIETELSDTGTVANNTVSGARYGYTAFDTGDVQVVNNTFSNNSVWSVGLSQDERRQATSGLAPEPSVPWIVQNVTVDNNTFGPGTGFQFYAMDKSTGRPASSMGITLNGNLFSAHNTASDPTMVGWGNTNSTVTYVNSPAALNSIAGATWNNAQESTSNVSLAQMASDAQALKNAVALPAAAASAAGVPTGTAQIGTFY